MSFHPIDGWPAETAKVHDDADGSREVFLPTGDRPAWATRFETGTGDDGGDLTVAGDPSPVELQLDHQMDGEVHLERRSSVWWLPGCLNTFDFSTEVVVRAGEGSLGHEVVRLSVPGARALAAALVHLADTADAGQAVGR